MSDLSQTPQSQLVQMLNQRYQSLLGEVRDELEHAGQQYIEIVGNVPGERDDAAVGDTSADLNGVMIDRQIHELGDIEAARQRIQDKIFGICVGCGNSIAYEQLLAYPAAKRCLACQQQHEKSKNIPSL